MEEATFPAEMSQNTQDTLTVRQLVREQVRFERKIVRAHQVSVFGCRLRLRHETPDPGDGRLFVRSQSSRERVEIVFRALQQLSCGAAFIGLLAVWC